ncbi:hypothetical protein ENINCK414B_09990 [Enterobacter intestinihominis]|nr:DNA polymerase V subunit UmuC [Enterobacter hormaechei]
MINTDITSPDANSYASEEDLVSFAEKGTLYFAGQGIQQQWQMKREMLSPRYTTRFSDLLRVR